MTARCYIARCSETATTTLAIGQGDYVVPLLPTTRKPVHYCAAHGVKVAQLLADSELVRSGATLTVSNAS